MKFVEPIRDPKKISQIKNMLKGEGKIRDLLLFELGINAALRVSDLLAIKVKDLFDEENNVREEFTMKEGKTKKTTRITITPKVKGTLKKYKDLYPHVVSDPNHYIFYHAKLFPQGTKAIGRKQAWRMVRQWCKDIGLKGNFGTHTLRKTWGYQARINAIPLSIIQHKLNHSALSITMRYLGITAEEIAEACNKLDL